VCPCPCHPRGPISKRRKQGSLLNDNDRSNQHNRPVAELIPYRRCDPERIRAAVERLAAFQKSYSLHGLSVRELPISIDPVSPDRVWGAALELAHTRGISLYDAVYLELALRLRLPLATLDSICCVSRDVADNEKVYFLQLDDCI